MEAEGISSWRIKLASILRDLGVRYTSTVFVIIYGLYITTWLAIEVEIYKNSTTVMILEIIELTWISLFLIEIMIFLASYGPKLYWRDLINIIEILVILSLIITIILDLVDRYKFRVKGLFRVLRVFLIFLRIKSTFEHFKIWKSEGCNCGATNSLQKILSQKLR